MPSGSTRVIVASLYCLPLTVVKSSEKPSDAKDKIKAVTSFLFTRCRCYAAFLFSYPGVLGQGEFPGEVHERVASLFVRERGGVRDHFERAGLCRAQTPHLSPLPVQGERRAHSFFPFWLPVTVRLVQCELSKANDLRSNWPGDDRSGINPRLKAWPRGLRLLRCSFASLRMTPRDAF